MSLEDILKFQVLFYSQDGVNSPVKDFIASLYDKNQPAGEKCLFMIKDLPILVYSKNKAIKKFVDSKHDFFELKVKHKNNEFRFFFVIDKSKIITIYGFTKKTQKTEKRDVNQGVNNLEMYLKNKKTIPFD